MVNHLANQMSKELQYRKKIDILYNILMEHWDSIPEEEHEELDKKLKAIGL
jgi:hypothetical protein